MTRNGLYRLTLDDLDLLLALQKQTLPDTLSARLGSRFNELYHRTMLGNDRFAADGYFASGMLVGYLSYTPDTVSLLRSTLRRHVLAYASALTIALLADPRRWGLVTKIARSVLGGSSEPSPDVHAEFLSIGVLPEFRGQQSGLDGPRISVAGVLLEHALAALRERGIRAVKACVTPSDPTANGFYRKHCFEFQSRVQRFGLCANLYVRELDAQSNLAAQR
jgi:ribosomal protein S18 acetylase RimI-like enzyme